MDHQQEKTSRSFRATPIITRMGNIAGKKTQKNAHKYSEYQRRGPNSNVVYITTGKDKKGLRRYISVYWSVTV